MYTLQVEQMSCSHCVDAVTRAVRELDGAARVRVDLAGKRVEVDSVRALGEIEAAIAAAGYPASGAAPA